eukprot:TRINITY_DN46064_c0_g1_i1.p1 TRINITY_DN46064_c0_g1~~TRINITY_DN46064_c0_g1_i1.p1  ORF type:complete len:317 (-),score=57.40 TRINITY_DN46064_c0_g1_i1:85-1008(-)
MSARLRTSLLSYVMSSMLGPSALLKGFAARNLSALPSTLAARSVSADSSEPALLKTELVDKVAVVTMLEHANVSFSWGTRICEHRINPLFLREMNTALDEAERAEAQALVVIGEGRFFSNGMDLQYIAANVAESTQIQTDAELLLARLLTLNIPTIAALNGHFAAAGAMLGLAFDKRVMPRDGKGLFFVPGIDIGLVYSQGMTELMKSKLPQNMQNDAICFARRYECKELLLHGVVNEAPLARDLRAKAIEVATSVKSKGNDAKTRSTMHGIKMNLYREAASALGTNVQDMGFKSGTWDATGRASKL